MRIVNDIRVDLWCRQGPEFLGETARIDVDGSLMPTDGECEHLDNWDSDGVRFVFGCDTEDTLALPH